MPASEALLQASQYLHLLQSVWWPFCRIMAVLLLAPVFNHKALSTRARLLLGLILALALAPALPPVVAVDVLSPAGVLLSLEQIAFGMLLWAWHCNWCSACSPSSASWSRRRWA